MAREDGLEKSFSERTCAKSIKTPREFDGSGRELSFYHRKTMTQAGEVKSLAECAGPVGGYKINQLTDHYRHFSSLDTADQGVAGLIDLIIDLPLAPRVPRGL